MCPIKIMITIVLVLATITAKAETTLDLDKKIVQTIEKHFVQYKDREYFSGIATSVFIPGQSIKNYYIGNISHEQNSPKISSDTLFQIGSITKSFTAAIILQLEKEKKLNINQTIQNWLPQYNKWSAVSIKKLLNMTSGLPNYSETPLWSCAEYANPLRVFTNAELIDYVYPKSAFSPPLKQGYFYSNTNYILAALIVEKITHNPFATELINRTIKLANLTNTFYSEQTLEKAVQARIAAGYNYNQYDNPALVGKNMGNNNMSWAAAAGGLISNSEDVIKWVQALFIETKILDATEQHKLVELISLSNGKPIVKTDKDNPKGFGLGVAQSFNAQLGRFWFYQGETMGFRALYMYIPCNGIIISSIFNSSTNSENDHAGFLMETIYKVILAQHPKLNCKF